MAPAPVKVRDAGAPAGTAFAVWGCVYLGVATTSHQDVCLHITLPKQLCTLGGVKFRSGYRDGG